MSRLSWQAVPVLLLLFSMTAQAQSLPRQIVGPGGCGAQMDPLHLQYQTHAVFLSSEGTAWDQPRQEVWITAFNPLSVAQWVALVLTADGNAVTLQPGVTLGPRQRWAWHANQLFREAGLVGNVNFSTVLTFELHGAASIATWSNNYQAVFYGTLVQSCEVPLFSNPYGGGQ